MNIFSPNVQNLFLLYNNQALIADIDKVNKKFSTEIRTIKKIGALTKILLKEVGSPALLNEIDRITKKTDLFYSPQRTALTTLIILMVLDIDPVPFLLDLDKNKNALTNPIWWEINPGQEGTALTISLSNFHSKTDMINFIEKRWPEIEKARKPFKITKTKIEKPKPYTDFARDWQMYSDKQTMSYSKLAEKYGFSEVNSAKMIIRKLRKRIASLYSS